MSVCDIYGILVYCIFDYYSLQVSEVKECFLYIGVHLILCLKMSEVKEIYFFIVLYI